MDIKKWVDFVEPNKGYARRITAIVSNLPIPQAREDFLRVTHEELGPIWARYSATYPAEPLWSEGWVDELLHNVAILRRIEKALGSWLAYEECVVLGQILYMEHFLYDDGFLINDPRDLGYTIGLSEGGALASCFDPDPRVNYLDITLCRIRIADFNGISERLIQKILESDKVRLIEFNDLPPIIN